MFFQEFDSFVEIDNFTESTLSSLLSIFVAGPRPGHFARGRQGRKIRNPPAGYPPEEGRISSGYPAGDF